MGIVSAVRRTLRSDQLLGARWPSYTEHLLSRGRKPRYVNDLEGWWSRCIAPWAADLLPEDVTPAMVCEQHQALAHKPVEANRAFDRCLSALYNWMRRRSEYVGANPCDAIDPFPETPRHRIADPLELSEIRSRLRAIEAAGGARGIAASCLLLIIATGLRRGEALNLRWPEVCDGFLELDTKTGYLMRFIDERAENLIAAMPRTCDRVYPVSLATLLRVWRDAREHAGCPDLTIHDLRRTYSSRLGDAGIPASDVAALMGQSTIVHIRHYRRLSAERMKRLAAQGGELMSEESTKRASSGYTR